MASKNEMDASCKLCGGSDMSGRPITMVLIVLMLAFPCVGQRAGGGMHGGGMSMGGPRPGFGGRPGFPNRPFFQFGFRHFRNFGGFGGPWWGYPGLGFSRVGFSLELLVLVAGSSRELVWRLAAKQRPVCQLGQEWLRDANNYSKRRPCCANPAS